MFRHDGSIGSSRIIGMFINLKIDERNTSFILIPCSSSAYYSIKEMVLTVNQAAKSLGRSVTYISHQNSLMTKGYQYV